MTDLQRKRSEREAEEAQRERDADNTILAAAATTLRGRGAAALRADPALAVACFMAAGFVETARRELEARR